MLESLLTEEDDGSMTRRKGVWQYAGVKEGVSARLRMRGWRCVDTAVQLNRVTPLRPHVDMLKGSGVKKIQKFNKS